MLTAETLNRVSDLLNIYWGFFLFLFGLLGILGNVLVLRHPPLRSNSCCTYMLAGSIASLIEIVFGLSDRIISKGLHVDWTSSSMAWCKIRHFLSSCGSLIALSCLVMSVVDRFLSICRKIKWRRLTSVYTARQVCLHLTILWMLSSIPILLDIRPIRITSDQRICRSSLLIGSTVVTDILSLCFYGIVPWCFMLLFGSLALRNIRHRYRPRSGTTPFVRVSYLDQQLISILFVQTLTYMGSSFPYCAQRIYDLITIVSTKNKGEDRLALDYLLSQIAELIFYFNYVAMFYSSYLASHVFRRSFTEVWTNFLRSERETSSDASIVHHQGNEYVSRHRRPRIFACLVPSTISPM